MEDQNREGQQKTMVNPVQVQKFLRGLDYPANKDEIVDMAEENGADQDVLNTLRMLPDREYNGPNAISDELGEME